MFEVNSTFSTVSVVDFEQLNTCWDNILKDTNLHSVIFHIHPIFL